MSRVAFPASFAQQRLWFLDRFEPGTAAYNLPYLFRIKGALQVDVLTRAFRAAVQRHASLRTVFDCVDDEVRQVVLSDVDIKIRVIDLTGVPEGECEAEALRIASEESKKPFDLSEGPLLRAMVFRLGPESCMLLLVMHHIITDGWSVSRLLRDVTKCYAAFVENKEPELPELPIRYTEYAQWQREYMSGEVLKKEVEHWKKTLAGAQTLLELPTDHARPTTHSWHSLHGAKKDILLDGATLAKVKSLAQKEGSTLFMVSMAAFQALLWRYTHQESILVGTPIGARNDVEVENLVGLFVNTLVFRADFGSNLSFRDLIRQVRSYALEAYMHQDMPFEKLVEELVPQRSLDRPPLFQVMFMLQNIPKRVFEVPGLRIKEIDFVTGIVNFDLSLEVWEGDDTKFHGWFEYNADLFEQSTMLRMVGHFERLLEAALENPDLPLAQLAILSPREREQVLVEWNRTATDYSRDHSRPCVHELFELQVERSPNAVAVVAGQLELTYRELNQRANQLAWYLLKRGAGPEVPIGLCIERGPGMVIALLGILKAGGAYVPLEPRVPDDRLSFMLADVKPRLVLTEQKMQRGIFGADTVLLDSDWPVIAQESTENPNQKLSPQTLAYVMYTSGSTGRPKGVPIEHGSVVNLLRSMQHEPGLSCEDVLLAVTTLTFDIAGLEMYLPLISGARLIVADSKDVVDGSRLMELLSKSGATFMQATPATWRLLLAAGWQGSPELKILCGGEALPRELANELIVRSKSVWNVYGPTETTIWSTAYRVTGREEASIPIGHPIANTSIYILDSQHNPVPINVRGEVYIGGDGLARGYLNRPELTAERFVASRLVAKSARLYRTGDLGRFRSNGEIEYRGRVDSQVKLRGFRIELGEIESVLASHATLREAVVTVTGEGEQQKLCSYVVVHEGTPEPAAGELRRYLRTKLPEHMVPATYSRVKRLPLLPSGKVDRGAMAASLATPLREETELIAPRNEIEAKLADIWQELLRVKQVGIEQNFFELGGHSLLVMQMMGRIRRAFGVELPVRSVFEAPTIAALALELEKAQVTGLKARAPILRRRYSADATGREAFPASFAQERLWFLDQFEPGTGTYNMSRVLRIRGPLNVDVLTRAFHAVVQRHGSLRTVFDSVEGETWQVVLPDLDVKIPIIDVSEVPAKKRESEALRIASEEAKKAFDLREGPLLRTLLVRLGPESWLLLIVMHHIITDGWSLSRLFSDVTKCYAAFLENKGPELPELPIQYTDYAQWQREYMSGEVLSKEVEHWKKTLAGAQTLLELATDHPRPPLQTWHGASELISLDAATLARLKSLAQSENATLFMVTMAAFQALLWRYTHQESILVGTPIGARNEVEVEDMIGLFVNTLVFRTDFASNLSFRDLIRQVRSYALEAYMHQELPFEKLVEELVPQRSLDTPPLFQVMFILQNIPKQVFEISGLSIKEMDFETGIAKFDLTLEAWEDTELHCRFEYNTDLFERSSILRKLGNFETLIQAAVENPDLPLAQLPILSEQEREQILVEWNRTATDYSRDHPQPCIHELFETQAEQSPDAVAVVAGNQEVSYRELNQRANQLARYLLKRGVGPEVPVSMCLDRGPGMMVALLGILKAGGAYVPLDPRLPDDRLSFMLADVKPRLLLTEQKMKRGVFGADTVPLDSDWNVIAQESTENPKQKLSSQTLAYVMYTSGSTGRPKGVLIEHGSVVNLLRSMQREPGMNRDDVLLALAIISFDMATPEMYLPLISGARMVIGSLEDAVDGNRLRDLISKNRVTFMQATPATWRLLLAAGWQGSPDLKIICGAEAFPAKLAHELRGRGKSLWNVYGPTETTVWSTVHRVTGQEEGLIPIGRPMANTSVYILDSNQNPVPVNVAGEIFIGGDGLARGYLNRPELTAEKFVPNRMGRKHSDAMYRTGDLGRFRSNGAIEYVGRVDNQVKLRGFRIELGEIESVLASHATLQEAVVIITGEGEQEKLSAYVVVNEGQAVPSAGELRRHLRAKLPEYMVPVTYRHVEKLPLLSTGKVDRGALAASSATVLPEEDELIAPRNEMEAKLADIWRELLKLERVGIEQNFFELGGHSLLALLMMARIRRKFEVELPVRSVFEAPTIAALTLELEKARAAGLKARTPISKPRHHAVTADARKEALLLELKNLSAEEARKFIEDAVGRKRQI